MLAVWSPWPARLIGGAFFALSLMSALAVGANPEEGPGPGCLRAIDAR